MSRAVEPDFTFNKEKFTSLLIKAQGKLTVTDYAQECGVSVAYMCKYLKGRFDKAPTPTTVKKMALYTAKNGVTQEELLEAAGYSISKYSDAAAEKNMYLRFEKLGIATITSALSECNFKWSVLQNRENSFFDFSIEINDGNLKQWSFEFKTTSSEIMRVPHNAILSYYGRLITSKNLPQSKFSFVTDSEVIFDEIKKCNPYMLPMYASVILIKTDDMKVVKEEYLETFLPISDDIKNEYTLK